MTAEPWFKKETFGAFWEKGYRDHQVSCMGGPSFEVAEILPLLPKKAKVLDLGCGEGRNSFFLAGHGHEVTAVDRSQAGIHKLMTLAEKYKIPVKGIVQEITEFPLIEEYDLVMGHGVLYYLENSVWRNLLTKIKKQTRFGGFNIFTLFVYNDIYPCVEEIQSAQYKHSFSPNELQEFYEDWTELRYDQYVKWDAHPGIPLHYHPIEKLVAQKPLRKIVKEQIKIGSGIPEEDFHKIEMGIQKDELVSLIGEPSCMERMPMSGVQFGHNIDFEKSASTTDGYCLELWYYGKYVIYVANGEIVGRAIYSTPPIRLRTEDSVLIE